MSVSDPSTRDTNGLFAKGNSHARQVAQLRAALLDRVTVDDIAAITDKLIELALDGNFPAIKLLLQYTLGKPGAMPEPTPDREPVPPAPSTATETPRARPLPAPEIRPELMREIERAIRQPGVGLPLSQPTDTKRNVTVSEDDGKRQRESTPAQAKSR